MGYLAGGRDGAGHGRVTDDELQRRLRPAVAAQLHCPAGQAMPPQLRQQGPFAKRAIDDDGDTTLLRQR